MPSPIFPVCDKYAEFSAGRPWKARLRDVVRDAAVCALGLRPSAATGSWLRFPYYHHVFDDECRGFSRQLDFMAAHGEFLSLDDAVALLAGGGPIEGRYFCITFDDGLGGCRRAVEILSERSIPAAFYVTADYMGRSLPPTDPAARTFGFRGRHSDLDFLSWDECRSMAAAGMIIGSHTCTHARLVELDDAGVEAELARSKAVVETELGQPCHHFCAPWGMPHSHYRPDRDPMIARKLGYRSFASGVRGAMRAGDDVFSLTRDHLLANWSVLQLRHFLIGNS